MSRTRRVQTETDKPKAHLGARFTQLVSLPKNIPFIVMLAVGSAVLWFHSASGNIIWHVPASLLAIVVAILVALATWLGLRMSLARGGTMSAFLRYRLTVTLGVVISVLIVSPVVSRWLRGVPLSVDQWLETGLWVAGFVASFYIEQLVIIVVHEVGHAIANLVVRYKVVSMRIGPIQLDFRRAHKHVMWTKGQFDGGSTAYVITSDRAPRIRHAVIYGAGVFAQLLLAGAGVWFLHWLETDSIASYLKSPVGSVAGISLKWYEVVQLLVLTLIALAVANGGYNLLATRTLDGKKLRSALINDADFTLLFTSDLIEGMSYRHVRPRDWPRDLLRQLTPERMAISAIAPSYWPVYLWLLDQSQHSSAGDILDIIVIWANELSTDDCAELAYFTARHRHQRSQAHEWMARAQRSALDNDFLALRRAQAAIALAEGNMEAARRAAQEGLAKMEAMHRQYKPTGIEIMRMEQLQEMAQLAAQ